MPDGTKIAEAIDYSVSAWKALTLYQNDAAVAIDYNLMERQIKPWKLGAKNWLFAGSALAGQCASVVMRLVQSAKLNGPDPCAAGATSWRASTRTRTTGWTSCCRIAGGRSAQAMHAARKQPVRQARRHARPRKAF